jgi:phage host-nuclease inhibitor protein Gam
MTTTKLTDEQTELLNDLLADEKYELESEIEGLKEEMNDELEAVREDYKQQIQDLKADHRDQLKEKRKELIEDILAGAI